MRNKIRFVIPRFTTIQLGSFKKAEAKNLHQERFTTNPSIQLIMRHLTCVLALFLIFSATQTRAQENYENKSTNNSNWYLMPSVGIPIAGYFPIDGFEEDEHDITRSFLSELEFGRQFNKHPRFTFETGISFQYVHHKIEGTYEGTNIDPDSKITANFFGLIADFGAGVKLTNNTNLLVRANIGNAFLFWDEEGSPEVTEYILPYGDFDLAVDTKLKSNIKLRIGASVIPPFTNYYAITPFVGLKIQL